MFNQFQINRVPINLRSIKSSIFLFLCIQSMLSFTEAKGSKDNEDGSNIIVLGAGGQLATSRYVPRKSGKGSSTIIIVGPQLIPIMVPYVKPTKRSKARKRLMSLINQNNGASESRLNFAKTTLQQYQQQQQQQLQLQQQQQQQQPQPQQSQQQSATVTSNPMEPQIVIRKTKNSPPILIEEVKGTEEGHIDYHVTSQPNSVSPQITQFPLNYNSVNKHQVNNNQHGSEMGSMYPSTVNSNPQMVIGDEDGHRSVKTHSNGGGLSGLNGFTTINQMSPMSSMNSMNSMNSMGSVNQLNQLNNQLNQLNGIKKIMVNSNLPTMSPGYVSTSTMNQNQGVAQHTISPYTYNSQTTSPISENDEFTIKSNKDNSENQEIYDEKVFNQFYGFDQVPSIELGNLPGEEHLPNLLFPNNNDNEEDNRRIDPTDLLDQENFDLGSYGPKRSGMDTLIQSSRLINPPMNEPTPTRWNDEFIPKLIHFQ